ncbi:hypothetical protein KIN20_017885 [Parelaphostrongylus tenuis]|uniref:Uncharacterized protein n=1 Tax=Parelaphostrongylus tenuis TaxID=148309 RepID=A0AAD5QU23_PARTN|nr:hypothetical protein KIN20_017885 [Parelaphostrongylus tenuis]
MESSNRFSELEVRIHVTPSHSQRTLHHLCSVRNRLPVRKRICVEMRDRKIDHKVVLALSDNFKVNPLKITHTESVRKAYPSQPSHLPLTFTRTSTQILSAAFIFTAFQ